MGDETEEEEEENEEELRVDTRGGWGWLGVVGFGEGEGAREDLRGLDNFGALGYEQRSSKSMNLRTCG